jgi:hypothetical protein
MKKKSIVKIPALGRMSTRLATPVQTTPQLSSVPPIQNANKPLESFANHQTKVFNSLRNSIKREGEMFLFGKPTKHICTLMLRIYHENILRILSDSKDKNSGGKLKCMFGVLEDTDGNLYVTISEAPSIHGRNMATDPDYMEKRKMVINLLKSARVEVNYPETESTIQAPILLDENRWRDKDFNKLKTPNEIRSKITENLKQYMIYNNNTIDTVNIYSDALRNMNVSVKYVDSFEYLSNRLDKEKKTFKPYKKYKKNGATWKAECNNGHLCTESKLFAYAAFHNISVKSFVAYWIGNELPPNHIMRSYSYRTTIKAGNKQENIAREKQQLRRLVEQCKSGMKFETFPKSIRNYEFIENVLASCFQAIAVACPGCFANINAYLSGEAGMEIWNSSNCYLPRRSSRGGGKTRKLKQKKQGMTRHKKA